MITAVDTSIIIDVLLADDRHGQASRRALSVARRKGSTVGCEVVWAEVSAGFPSPEQAASAMEQLAIEFRSIDRTTAMAAGAAWRAYRSRGGRRDRIIADFLIGAHALSVADRLLTRDRGFYRTHFRRLRVVTPEEVAG